MIQPFYSRYLTATKDYRELSILQAISESPKSSQHYIAQVTHLSSSMVNNYIKKMRAEGYIKVIGATNRTQSYHLTSNGRSMLRASMLMYSSDIVQFYVAVKREISKILNGYYEEGIRTIMLFGAADTADVVYAAVKQTPLIVIGIVDSDVAKQGRPFNGFTVQPPEYLNDIRYDAVVITSFAKQEEIHQSIKLVASRKIRIKKLTEV